MRARRFVLPVLVVFFVAARLAIVHSTGHLLFHLDAGEYGIFRGLRLFLATPVQDILFDHEVRFRFGLAMVTTGDTGLHVSLVLAGLMTHIAVTELDWPVATLTLRHLGLGVSTAAFLLWLVRLWRSADDGGALARRFALLWLVAPPLFMKVTVLFWGTHEQVVFWYALFLVLLGGWIGKPQGLAGSLLRALTVGALGAALMAINTSLILPASFFGVWIALEATRRSWRERGRVWGALSLGALAAAGVGGFLGAWRWLTSLEVLATLGLEPSVFSNDKLSHIEGADSLVSPSKVWVAFNESQELWPAMAAAIWVLAAALWRRRKHREEQPADRPLVQYCAAYLLVGWLAVAVMPFAYEEGTEKFFLRYTAHLHPIGFVVLAAWTMGAWPRFKSFKVRSLALAVWVVLWLPGQLAMIDLSNLEAGQRYDGVRPFFATFGGDTHLESPPLERVKHGGVSDEFAKGLGVIRAYQIGYWGWNNPDVARSLIHYKILPGFAGNHAIDVEAPGFDKPDFYRGMGYTMRLIMPPGHEEQLEALWQQLPQESGWLQEGYELSPEDLEWKP